MKHFILPLLVAALCGSSTFAAPVSQSKGSLVPRIIHPCPDIACPKGESNQPSGPNGDCGCFPIELLKPRIIHPWPEIACPEGEYSGVDGDCGCLPVRPLPSSYPLSSGPEKRKIHCDLECPPGTAYDPNAPGTCNCDLKVSTTSRLAKRENLPPYCGPYACLPGTEYDPSGPPCNCNLIVSHALTTPEKSKKRDALPASAGAVERQDALEKRECDLICVLPGYHTSPDGCGCVKDTSTTTAPAKRNPFPTPVCRYACLPGTAHDPNGPPCNCNLIVSKALDTREAEKQDALEKRKCELVCAEPGYHTSPDGCGCVKNTPTTTALAKRSPLPTPVCHYACLPGTAHDPNGPPCNCDLIVSKTLDTRAACPLICPPGQHLADGRCACVPDTVAERDLLTKRECEIVCPLDYTRSSSGCGCEPLLVHSRREAAVAPRCENKCPTSLSQHTDCACFRQTGP